MSTTSIKMPKELPSVEEALKLFAAISGLSGTVLGIFVGVLQIDKAEFEVSGVKRRFHGEAGQYGPLKKNRSERERNIISPSPVRSGCNFTARLRWGRWWRWGNLVIVLSSFPYYGVSCDCSSCDCNAYDGDYEDGVCEARRIGLAAGLRGLEVVGCGWRLGCVIGWVGGGLKR